MTTLQGLFERSSADGHPCINSVSVNFLTKGQGGAILLMECTTFQERKKKKMLPTGGESCGSAKC